jgi:hypothetical protein
MFEPGLRSRFVTVTARDLVRQTAILQATTGEFSKVGVSQLSTSTCALFPQVAAATTDRWARFHQLFGAPIGVLNRAESDRA